MGSSNCHLSALEREEISRGLVTGLSCRAIARQLNRHPSSILREIRRHAPSARTYRAAGAHRRAIRSAARPRRERKLLNHWLARYVCIRLALGWSPQQIAQRLRVDYPWDMQKRLPHETIYAAIYIVPRGKLRKLLLSCLRQARKVRRRRSRGTDRRGQIPNRTPIALRPLDVDTRLIPGHWEGDLIKGKANRSAVGTLVERTTRLVVLVRMRGRDARSVCDGFTRKLRTIPAPMRKTLTYDQGREMTQHQRIVRALKMKTYFADPHSPWQRGSNENTNGLLRQYLPRNIDLSTYSQIELNAVARVLNTRPRKTLNWRTPEEAWAAELESIDVALGT